MSGLIKKRAAFLSVGKRVTNRPKFNSLLSENPQSKKVIGTGFDNFLSILVRFNWRLAKITPEETNIVRTVAKAIKTRDFLLRIAMTKTL